MNYITAGDIARAFTSGQIPECAIITERPPSDAPQFGALVAWASTADGRAVKITQHSKDIWARESVSPLSLPSCVYEALGLRSVDGMFGFIVGGDMALRALVDEACQHRPEYTRMSDDMARIATHCEEMMKMARMLKERLDKKEQ